MTIQVHYKTKKELKNNIGSELDYTETNIFKNDYYYSKSKKQNIKFADMHIDHFLRAFKLHKEDKSKVDIETAELIEQLKKQMKKINKLRGIYELAG